MADACRLADVLLHNLWRWVSSQQAAMYSQSLHLAVAALQRKMLAQLVAELTRLGATVVAANASSLILGTGKPDTPSAVGQAPTELQPAVSRWHYMALMEHPGEPCSTDACSGMRRYVDYLLDALKRRELFSWLHFTPQTFWHVLLLRDRYNYLGLVAPVTDALKQQLSQQPGMLTQVCPGSLVSHAACACVLLTGCACRRAQACKSFLSNHSQSPRRSMPFGTSRLAVTPACCSELHKQIQSVSGMQEYLVPATQDAFQATITEFMFLPWRHAQDQLDIDNATQVSSDHDCCADCHAASNAATDQHSPAVD